MRIDNRNVKSTVITIYFLLVLLAILALTLFKPLGILEEYSLYIVGGTIVLIVVFYAIEAYFEYDSDGLKVSIINKGLILTEYLNYREKQLDFSRPDLKSFKMRKVLLYRTLTLVLKNSDGSLRYERFNITFVSRRKRRLLKQSLRKIIIKNKKN